MVRSTAVGLLLLVTLTPGCKTPGLNGSPHVKGSEAILAEDHEVLAYLAIGGVT